MLLLTSHASAGPFKPNGPAFPTTYGATHAVPMVSSKTAEINIIRVVTGENFFSTGKVLTADLDPEVDEPIYKCATDQLAQLNSFMTPIADNKPRKVTIYLIQVPDLISDNFCVSRVNFSSPATMFVYLCYLTEKNVCKAVKSDQIKATYELRFESNKSRQNAHGELLKQSQLLLQKMSK
jgi:hypothetical protein